VNIFSQEAVQLSETEDIQACYSCPTSMFSACQSLFV